MLPSKQIIILITIMVIYLTALTFSSFINSDFGKLEVTPIDIPGQEKIAALIYKPKEASETTPFPAIVLSHGVSGSKQMMSQIAIELAKNGFVALTIDLIGHGDTEGTFGGFGDQQIDKTLGMQDAVKYAIEQPFINSSKIGLVGHSLGAGAARATAFASKDVKATVFIAGGLDEAVENKGEYGVLNFTFPKNLLIIIGQHDVLFDIEQTKKDLIPAFGNQIEENRIYGNFSENTARQLIIPNTTHLLEPADPETVTQIVYWMTRSLKPQNNIEETELSYVNREIAITIGLAAFTILIFPISQIIFIYFPPKKPDIKDKEHLKDWKLLIIWGTLALVLFLPMFFVGSQIPFPPLIFGNSFSWWLLTVGIAGLIVCKKLLPKTNSNTIDIKSALTKSFNIKNLLTATTIFLILYSLVHLTQTIFLTDLRIVTIPLFGALNNPKRVLALFTFIPFYLIYFFVEGVYFHKLRQHNTGSQTKDLIKTITIRTAPYLILIILNYVPMFLFDIRIFPSFIGFIMEFILGIIPLFIITITYSWWFHKKTNNLLVGTILNTLLFAWTSAAIFPISI